MLPWGECRSMRFGVFLTLDYHPGRHPGRPLFVRQALGLAEVCDGLGLDVWVAEHHFSDYGVTPSPAGFLAAAAQRTRRVRLGSAVAVLPLQHPLRTAEDYAWVDVISEGRLDFGVGSGYLAHELDNFAVTAEEKRARFDSALNLILTAWRGEEVRSDGPFWHIPGARLNLLPVQRPHPPVWLGVTRPDPIPFAGAAGRNLLVVPYIGFEGSRGLGLMLERYRHAWSAAGHPGIPRVGVACHAFVGEKAWTGPDDPAYAAAEAAFGLYLDTRRMPGARFTGAPVSRDFVWFGDAGQVSARVEEMRGLGVDTVLLLCDFGGLDPNLVRASLSRFAGAVAPGFASAP